MVGHLRQLVEASQLQAIAEPWVAGARDHRIWPARRDCQSFQDAIYAEDRPDEDRLRESSAGIGLAAPQQSLRMYIHGRSHKVLSNTCQLVAHIHFYFQLFVIV